MKVAHSRNNGKLIYNSKSKVFLDHVQYLLYFTLPL